MPTESVSTSDAKKKADGASVEIGGGTSGGVVVTAVFDECIYVESPDRSSGIKVTNATGERGRQVRVVGKMATDINGERYIWAESINPVSPEISDLPPVGMTNRILGGGDFHYDPLGSEGQRGVGGWVIEKQPDGSFVKRWGGCGGLNNVGLLVKTWGKVLKTGPGYFYIDDGSNLVTGSMFLGLQVKCGSISPPPSGGYVVVTGVVTLRKAGDKYYPAVRVRDAGDVHEVTSVGLGADYWSGILDDLFEADLVALGG